MTAIPDHIVTSGQLCEEANITYRQLDYWCRTNLLPGMPNNTGHGVPRHFTREQAAIVRTAAQLVHAGFDTRTAARLADGLTFTPDATVSVWTDHVRVEVTLLAEPPRELRA